MRAFLVAAAVIVLGALIALTSFILDLREATAPRGPEAFVNATWAVYRFGPGHQNHVKKLGLECKACHRAQDKGFDRPGPAPCMSCHEDHARIRHATVMLDREDRVVEEHGERSVTNCISCHGFGPEPDTRPTDCLACHAKRQDKTHAITKHAESPCTSCHEVHENKVSPMDCAQCHPIGVSHGALEKSKAERCLDCHDMHANKEIAEERCLDCHSERGVKPIPATATFGQHACTGCHRPHGFKKEEAASCTSCHEKLSTIHGAAHSDCKACHSPHAVRESVREKNPCLTCHARVSLSHKKSETEITPCITCHTPHPEKGAAQPSACSTCHAEIGGSKHQAHVASTACVDCHKPHAFASAVKEKTLCQNCHAAREKLLEKHKGHSDCASCHQNLPHGPELTPVACASCHKPMGALVNKGHNTCTGCHDAHTGALDQRPCASCHARESTLHPKGHDVCTNCHEPHAGAPKPGVADCSGCHDKTKLPGLHEVKEHAATCTNCHEAHGSEAPALREHCVKCHTEQKTHQPDAQRCDGCHAFIRGGGR